MQNGMYTRDLMRGALGAALLLASCAPPDHVVVSRTREVSQADPAVAGASHAQRFSPEQQSSSRTDEASLTELLRDALDWDVPQGWRELSAGGMRIASLRPALVHLHLISRETMSIAEVGRIKAPLVWTFHDMWAFAGTEHYPEPETHTRFQGGYLANEGGIDLSRWTWRRKQRHWNTGAMTIVTPSRWMGDCVANSRLFEGARVEVIPNGIDTNQFKPLDRSFARQALNLPQDPPLILFGAMNATSDRRKGFDLLMEALGRVAANTVGPKPELLVFGSSGHAGGPDYGLKTHFAGRVQDASSLALLYAASDVFVAPSRQDNLPNTIVETLASGTPAVAFNIGGMPDMIDHQQNGFLAQPFDAAELAAGISWVLATNAESGRLREAARKKVEDTFTIGHQVRACTALYEDLLDRPLRQQEVPGAASVV